jgi:predicted ArsR family transcriptional regulator
VAQVGIDVGGQMEAEFRAAERIVGRLTPEQLARCYVRLKHAIDGDFSVLEVSDDRIVLVDHRCPFGTVVQHAPSLCRMTSSVFGGIAARNTDAGAAVLLEELIAVGDPVCHVVVHLTEPPPAERSQTHRYLPASRH